MRYLFTFACLSSCLLAALITTSNAEIPAEAKKPDHPVASDKNVALAEEIKNPHAFYFTASDGVRIACDIWFPKDYDRKAKEAKPLATIMRMTRYLREIHVTDAAAQDPNFGPMVNGFKRDVGFGNRYTGAGFAYISVDARGTGASYGSRAHPWTDREIKDYGEIADWISRQSWSNGRIGAVGISYEGNTAEFIAANAHPAVKVVVPMFDEFDVFHHVSHPGGVFNDWFVKNWSAFNKIMDSNDLNAFANRYGMPVQMLAMLTTGSKPVDHEDGLKWRDEAVKEHAKNADVYELAKATQFRDEKIASNGSCMDDLSPFNRRKDIERGDAIIFGWASWLDAGTAEGALARFMTYKNKQQVMIGPWPHGGGANQSPHPGSDKDVMRFADQSEAVMSFLKTHLQSSEEDAKKARENFDPSIHYYMHGTGQWRRAKEWPPKAHLDAAPDDAVNGKQFWSFDAQKGMAVANPNADKAVTSSLSHKVDFSTTTGTNNRWHTQIGKGVSYEDRRLQDRKLLTFTSAPFEQDVEVIGSPEVTLSMSVDAEDAAVFVYLSVFDPASGSSTYVTEGMLRLVHRKAGDPAKAPYAQFGTYHSFNKSDAMPVAKNEKMTFNITLFPTALFVPKGKALRVSIGGADADTFARYPAEGDLNFKVNVGTITDSGVHLPIAYIKPIIAGEGKGEGDAKAPEGRKE